MKMFKAYVPATLALAAAMVFGGCRDDRVPMKRASMEIEPADKLSAIKAADKELLEALDAFKKTGKAMTDHMAARGNFEDMQAIGEDHKESVRNINAAYRKLLVSGAEPEFIQSWNEVLMKARNDITIRALEITRERLKEIEEREQPKQEKFWDGLREEGNKAAPDPAMKPQAKLVI